MMPGGSRGAGISSLFPQSQMGVSNPFSMVNQVGMTPTSPPAFPGGSAPMLSPPAVGAPYSSSMAQPAPQQPQMDPAAIQARLDEFLANNPDRASISLPFGGNIDIANLRDRMARLSALMGRGMTVQEAMGNQRAAVAQGHDLNNDGIVTDAEYRQSTMPAPALETPTSSASNIFLNLLDTVKNVGNPALTPQTQNPEVQARERQRFNMVDPRRVNPAPPAPERMPSTQDRIMQLMAAMPRR
jgi:hypothetical protein